MTKIIAVSNRRGGVGKTTIAMILAYGLSVARRQKVLLIDLDAQASTSIVMMGHKRWQIARETNRTTSALLALIANNGAINANDYVTRGIGDVLLADGSNPALDIIPSSHDLDDKELLLLIAQQARSHRISDVFDAMQARMGQIIRSAGGAYDQVVIDCAPGLSQLVWGALRTADLVLIPYIPDRTAEDNVGWLAQRLHGLGGVASRTVPNRVSGQDSRAQGIIAAVSAEYPPLGIQIPATQPLATALDYRDRSGTLASKFGPASQHVNALADAILETINQPICSGSRMKLRPAHPRRATDLLFGFRFTRVAGVIPTEDFVLAYRAMLIGALIGIIAGLLASYLYLQKYPIYPPLPKPSTAIVDNSNIGRHLVAMTLIYE